jgi:hypothetical protein
MMIEKDSIFEQERPETPSSASPANPQVFFEASAIIRSSHVATRSRAGVQPKNSIPYLATIAPKSIAGLRFDELPLPVNDMTTSSMRASKIPQKPA